MIAARTGVFVDAGYFFRRGGIALAGGDDLPREVLVLDERALVAALTTAAEAFGGDGSLLRIYWYDAKPQLRDMSVEQARLADLDDVKVKLGVLNAYGQQKGVDSLITLDLTELARNGAMTHAVLVAGDEDLRAAVEAIQSYGVRVLLVGIDTARGHAQSRALRRAADRTVLWDAAGVATVLSVRPLPEPPAPGEFAGDDTPPVQLAPETLATIESQAASLASSDAETILSAYQQSNRIPYAFDAKLLATVAATMGRELLEPEKWEMRRAFAGMLARMHETP